MSKKLVAICPHCAEGNKPSNGKHWIVGSISLAEVEVVKCNAGK